MPIQLDPEGNETKALFEQAGAFIGLHVLEIGCGDGRLTCRYAGQAASVVAIDPGAEKIALARANLPAGLLGRVDFLATDLLQFASQAQEAIHSAKFDLAILAWSL
jgi:predicted RNA methylase